VGFIAGITRVSHHTHYISTTLIRFSPQLGAEVMSRTRRKNVDYKSLTASGKHLCSLFF
jgi:hypothetical protein